MQSVEMDEFNKLDERFAEILKEFPDKRRELHERISKRLEQEVGQQIFMSGVNDESGRIESWQQGRVGSGGGYAAVSAKKGATGANSPGAITNYLENGHRIRPPGNSRRKGRAKKPYVDGFHFYKYAGENAEAIAVAETQKLADEIAGKLGG